ncbi:MAG TPA: HEAT repeat domain-containing protein [Bryobacteraceae bacterium]|nr:HEAT repeat domain-containing protein [Bryobacteraceae bacterium]
MKRLVLFAIACAAFAQNWQPTVVDAKFETRASSGDLASQIRASSATWFGYAVKSKRHTGDNCCDRCRLEESSGKSSTHPIPLEGSDVIALLFRVENETIEKIQVHSLGCPLDAGGLPFVWLNGVSAAASESFLKNLVTSNTSRHVGDSAIFAISQHDDPNAIPVLEDLARPPQPAHLRGQAIFWLAQEAGSRAASFIKGAIENDPDTEVKKKAVFALSQLPKDEGVPKLIQVAQENRNPEVRKQAFFWLGQSNDPRALAFIEQVLTR